MLNAIQSTLADFRDQCDSWELELDGLCEQLESLDGPVASGKGRSTQSSLDELAHQMQRANHQLHERQDQIVHDLSDVRAVLEQQSTLFSSLLEAREADADLAMR